MAFDVVIVGAGPAGLAAAIRLKQLAPDALRLRGRKRRRGRRAHPVGRRAGDARAERADPGLAGRAPRSPRRRPRTDSCSSPRRRRAGCRRRRRCTTRALHRLARQCGALARPAGRGAGGGNLSWLCRGRAAGGRRPGGRHRHRRYGHRQGRPAHRKFSARHGAARALHAVRRRLPRFAQQAADEQFRLRDGHDPQTYAIGIKELWEVPAASTGRA